MLETDWHKDAVLLYVVVNAEMASKVIAQAKRCGIRGATVMLGRGTVSNKWLNAIGVVDSRKEVVIMGADAATGRAAMAEISKRFHFEKPNRGIAFAVAVRGIVGTDTDRDWPSLTTSTNTATSPVKWQLITAIVARGQSEDVVDAAQMAGSKGGTIIAGRGSGVAQTELVLGMEIEPEKDIVFILAPAEKAPQIEDAIDERLDLEKPNHGIMFTQNVVAVSGLYQGD